MPNIEDFGDTIQKFKLLNRPEMFWLSSRKRIAMHKIKRNGSRKTFFAPLSPTPSRAILSVGFIGIGRSHVVKYLATNFHVPFIIVFLNKFLDNKLKYFLINDIYIEDSNEFRRKNNTGYRINLGSISS